MILLSRNSNRKITKLASKNIFERKLKETDERVKLLIDHPEIITSVEEALEKDWSTHEVGFEKLLFKHKKEMIDVFKKMWDKEQGKYEAIIKEQNELLKEIKETINEDEEDIKEFIEENNEKFTKLLSDRLDILEEKLLQKDSTKNNSKNSQITNIKLHQYKEYIKSIEEVEELETNKLKELLNIICEEQQIQTQQQILNLENLGKKLDLVITFVSDIKKDMQSQNSWNIKFEQEFNSRMNKIDKYFKNVIEEINSKFISLKDKLRHIQKSVLTDKHLNTELEVYVQTRGKYDTSTEEKTLDIEKEVNNFFESKDEEDKVLILEGDSGGGKSTFMRYMYRKLWKEYNENKPIPIMLELGQYIHSLKTNNLISAGLKDLGLTEKDRSEIQLKTQTNITFRRL